MVTVERKFSVSVLKIEVVTGTSASGAAIHSTRMILDTNPALADVNIGNKIAALQAHDVQAIKRRDTPILEAKA